MLVALIFNVKIDTSFAVGIFPVVPLLLLTSPGYQLMPRAHVYATRDIAIVMAVLLIAAPAIAYVRFAWVSNGPTNRAARQRKHCKQRSSGRPAAP